MKVLGIVQARMGSTRLPNKVLMNIMDKPLLWHMIYRLKHSKEITQLIIATSTNKIDDPIEIFCSSIDIECFRGSENDVLSRFYYAAIKYGGDIIARFTGDCPLIDPLISDDVIKTHIASSGDYSSNTLKRTFPRGLDTEVFSFRVLEKAFNNANKEYEREHVTPYIYENPKLFKLINLEAKGKLRRPDIRITVDTKEDLKLVREIYSQLYKPNQIFYTEDIIKLLNKNPRLLEINKNVKQKQLKEK